MVLAIATPLVGQRFRLTNVDRMVDPRQLSASFGFRQIVLMNDFAAQALAALALGPDDFHPLGPGKVVDGQPKAVLGPGTGLGIAQIVKVVDRWAIIPGEGGHIDLGPRTDREMAIWPHLIRIVAERAPDNMGRVSAEEALSGRGLVNLYKAIRAASSLQTAEIKAEEISARAIGGKDACAVEAVGLFVTLLARVAGDMALLTLARGGVFLAGGIAQKLQQAFDSPAFRTEFENKAPHREIMASLAVNLVTHPTAALEGLAAYVRTPQSFSLGGAERIFVKD
jgi:glucokinase